jgi:hypothetical protein
MTVSAETAPNEKEATNFKSFYGLKKGTRISFVCDKKVYSGNFKELLYFGYNRRWGIYYQRDKSMNVLEVAYLSEIDQPKILP